MVKFLLFVTLSFGYFSNFANSQFVPKSDWTAGINFSYLSSKHVAQFQSLPNVPNCCNLFTDASGKGFNIGLSLQNRLYGFNYIIFNMGFQKFNGDFFETEPEWVIINHKLTDAKIGHYLNTDFNMAFIELNYKYGTHFGLGFFTGIHLGFFTSSSYDQKEVLLEPEFTGTFENGTRTRNVQKGNIDGTSSVLLYANIGIEYEIFLDQYDIWIISPFVKYSYGFTSYLEKDKWRVMNFSVGLSFKLNPFDDLSSPLIPRYKLHEDPNN